MNKENFDRLGLIRGAVLLSTPAVRRRPDLMTGQLVGRLSSSGTPGMRDVLSRGAASKTSTWLSPQSVSLDPPGGTLIQTIRAHRKRVSCLAMSGGLAVSGSNDGTVRIWDLSAGREITVLDHSKSEVSAVAMSSKNGIVVTGSSDGQVRIWNPQTNENFGVLYENASPIRALAFDPRGHTAVSGSDDGVLRLWDSETGKIQKRFGDHDGPITVVTMLPDGHRVAAGSEDGTIRIWHLHDRTQTVLYSGNGAIRSIGISPDGRHAVSCVRGDREARVWDLDQAEAVLTLRCELGRDHPVFVQFSPDGTSLVGASVSGFIHIWNTSRGSIARVIGGALFRQKDGGGVGEVNDGEVGGISPGDLFRTGRETHSTEMTVFALSPDGLSALSGSEGGDLKQWNLKTHGAEPTHGPSFDAFRIAVCSEPAQAIIDPEESTGPKIVDLTSGEVLLELDLPWATDEGSPVVAVSPDGSLVVRGSADGSLLAWGSEAHLGGAGVLLGSVGSHEGPITLLSISGDGRYILSGSEDEILKVWDLENEWREVAELDCQYEIHSAAITPDGHHVLSGLGNGEVLLWDLDEPWEELETLAGHSESVLTLRIHPEGDEATSVCGRGRVITWDTESWQRTTVKSLGFRLGDADITPDAQLLAGVRRDGGIVVWDLTRESAVAEFWGETPIKTVRITADGEYVVAGESNGRGHFLRLIRPPEN